MIKIIREDCQYFLEQMNRLLENENGGQLHIVKEKGEEAMKDVNEIFSTWGRDEIYACTLSDSDKYQFDIDTFNKSFKVAYVAKLGSNPVGFITLEDFKGGGNVSVGVKSGDSFRNKGIASKLLAKLLEWFNSKNNTEYEYLFWGCLDSNAVSKKMAQNIEVKPYVNSSTSRGETINIGTYERKAKKIPKEYIKGVTLLDKNQFSAIPEQWVKVKAKVPCEYTNYWWLKSKNQNNGKVSCVEKSSIDNNCDPDERLGIRPVLILSNEAVNKLKEGDLFSFGGYNFVVLGNGLALCLYLIGDAMFREDYEAKDCGDYEKSDVKKKLDDWFKEVLSK